MIKIFNLILVIILILLGIAIPKLGLVLLGICCVLLLLFIGVHVYTYSWVYWNGIKLRKRLRKNDRIMTLQQAEQKISQGEGSIIIEAPTAGWNVNRIWWTQDDQPLKKEMDKLEEFEKFCNHVDHENYDKYISEDSGLAKLVDIFVFTQKTEKYLMEHFGRFDFCFVPSALVYMQRKINDEKCNADTETN